MKTNFVYFLASSEDEEETRNEKEDDGRKWWDKDETNAEYELDIDIPLVKQGGSADYSIMVEDTQDVYSMPTHSHANKKKNEPDKQKNEPDSTYYNLDPSPAASPSTHKKKSVRQMSKCLISIQQKVKFSVYLFIFLLHVYSFEIEKEEERREKQAISNG